VTSSGVPVEIWLVDLARSGSALAAVETATPRLSADEHERAAALGKNGGDWRLYRIALRIILERIAGPGLRHQPLRIGPLGKPGLPEGAGIEFNLAHTRRYALIAVSSALVGVDLEEEREVRFPQDRQQAMLAAARAIAGDRPASRGDTDHDILRAWTRLEAWAKARGSGIGVLLQDLGIRGSRTGKCSSGTDFGAIALQLLQKEAFTVRDLDLPAPLYGALAVKAASPELQLRQLPDRVDALSTLEPSALTAKPLG